MRDLGTYVAAAVGALALVGLVWVARRALVRRRRSAEAAMWRDAARVAELTRAGVVGELEAWVSRELGTPIASLLNNLGAARRLLASGERGNLPEVIVAVDEAHAQGECAALALRRMRQLHGTDGGKRVPIDLNEIAREAIRLVGRHAAVQGVALSAALGERVPAAIGDPAQILQVALCLILRAIDSASTSRPRAVVVRTAPGEDGMELAVSDSGAGISEVDRAHMFKPSPGMRCGGLSIAAVRSIVEAHEGRLAVERPDSGALFRVVLPAPDRHPAREDYRGG